VFELNLNDLEGLQLSGLFHFLHLPHLNFFKFHVPTSGSAHALSAHLLPLSRTHFLATFVSVNLSQLSRNTLKHFISNLHFLTPPSDPLPQSLWFNFWYWRFINSFTYIHTYLKVLQYLLE